MVEEKPLQKVLVETVHWNGCALTGHCLYKLLILILWFSKKYFFQPPKVIYYRIVQHRRLQGILDIEHCLFCQVELVSTYYQNLFSPFQVQILIPAVLSSGIYGPLLINHVPGPVSINRLCTEVRKSLTWNSFWVTTSLFSRSSLLKNSLNPCKEHFWTSMFRTSEFINSIRLNSGPDWFV